MRRCELCRKTVFESLSHVEFFLQKDNRRNELRAYPCEHGNGYHVTSMSSKDANRRFGVKPLKYSEQFKKYMK